VPPYDSNKEDGKEIAIRLLMRALRVADGCSNDGRKVRSCAHGGWDG